MSKIRIAEVYGKQEVRTFDEDSVVIDPLPMRLTP